MGGRAGKVIKNTFFQLLGKAVSLLTALVITALITRRFGESGYGLFTLMTTFPAYLYLVVDFGVNAIVIRQTARTNEGIGEYFRNLYTFRFVFALITVILAALLLPFIPFKAQEISLVRWGIVISLFTVVGQALYLSGNAVFQKFFRYDLANAALSLGNFLVLILTLTFLGRALGLLWLVGAATLGSFFTVILSFSFLRAYLKDLRPAFDMALWRRFLEPSLPVGLGLVAMVVMAKADMFLLSTVTLPKSLGYSNAEALGLYGLSYKIFENALIFPTFFINALYPLMIEDRREGPSKLRATVKKAGLFLGLFGMFCALAGIVLSPWVIELLGGPHFARAVPALQVLLASLPVFFPSALFVWLLVTLGKERLVPIIYSFGAVFNIAANLFFIPRFGFFGSAVITAVTEVLVTIATAYFGLKTLFVESQEYDR